MPLTDNQLIILLIIYSSPCDPRSILLAMSPEQSTATFNGLANSLLCRGRVKTTMLALANLHFYTVPDLPLLINSLGVGGKKLNTNNSSNNICNHDASVALEP